MSERPAKPGPADGETPVPAAPPPAAGAAAEAARRYLDLWDANLSDLAFRGLARRDGG